MKKLSIFLVLVMLLTLAACGGDTGGSSTSKDPVDSSQASTPADTGGVDSLRIGIWTSLTGASAIEGELVQKGAELAADQWNKKGGVNGRSVEFIIYDDQSTTEGAVTATTRLIENDKVDAIMGSNLSNSIVATADLIEAAGIPFVGNGTGSAWTNAGYHYIFRGTCVNTYINEAFVRTMAEEMGVKDAAFLYVETENGQTAAADIEDYCEKYGVNLVYEGTYQSADSDFTGQVANIVSSKPEGVMLFGLANELSLVVRQLRQGGYNGYIYMAEAGASVDLMQVAGDAANGIVFSAAYVVPPTPEESPSDRMGEMLKAYVDLHGGMPATDVAFRAYDGMNLLLTAFANAEDIDDKDSIRDAFLAIQGYEGIGGTFDFTAGTGDGLSTCNVYMIIDGSYHIFDRAELEAAIPVN